MLAKIRHVTTFVLILFTFFQKRSKASIFYLQKALRLAMFSFCNFQQVIIKVSGFLPAQNVIAILVAFSQKRSKSSFFYIQETHLVAIFLCNFQHASIKVIVFLPALNVSAIHFNLMRKAARLVWSTCGLRLDMFAKRKEAFFLIEHGVLRHIGNSLRTWWQPIEAFEKTWPTTRVLEM